MNRLDILIVEDEAIVALDIKRIILKMGFSVTGMVMNYEDAMRSIDEKKPDILLLDINLKNSKSGIAIAKEVKRISDIPIVYLTAFSDDKTIEEAVETNPIGYLVKPFKEEDLKSVLKLGIYKINTHHSIESSLIPIGKEYFFDTTNQTLFYKQHPIKLSVKERKLLEILIKFKGELVPFYTLEEYIWDGNFVSESSIRTLLYRLRSKLEYKLIETTPHFGLKLVTDKE